MPDDNLERPVREHAARRRAVRAHQQQRQAREVVAAGGHRCQVQALDDNGALGAVFWGGWVDRCGRGRFASL